jgi:hypothetical protein
MKTIIVFLTLLLKNALIYAQNGDTRGTFSYLSFSAGVPFGISKNFKQILYNDHGMNEQNSESFTIGYDLRKTIIVSNTKWNSQTIANQSLGLRTWNFANESMSYRIRQIVPTIGFSSSVTYNNKIWIDAGLQLGYIITDDVISAATNSNSGLYNALNHENYNSIVIKNKPSMSLLGQILFGVKITKRYSVFLVYNIGLINRQKLNQYSDNNVFNYVSNFGLGLGRINLTKKSK